jgi:hypothetical protein
MTVPAHARPLAAAYGGLTAVVSPLTDRDLLRPTRCHGWLIADLLFHVLCDAQRALVTFASPAPGPSTADSVSYWTAYPGSGRPSDGADAAAWWVRRSTSAFPAPSGVRRLWDETAPAAARAAAAADPTTFVATQGLVLTVADFIATLVTEAVIHHLDMLVDLPDAAVPAPEALAIAVSTMDGLMSDDAVRPASWSPTDYLLKAGGRLPLTARERRELGSAAGWFPLLS